jgi:ornithine decarboxylase
MTASEKKQLQEIAAEHGTPVFVIDHDKIRENFRCFREHLPDVQPYFAVKSNSDCEVVRTLYREGASFDVASLPEFALVYENIKALNQAEQQDFIWDKIIYANTIKPAEVLAELNKYKVLVTFDNSAELAKIKKHAPDVGLIIRIRVPNTGSMVELSSKFGADPAEAVDLVLQAASLSIGVGVEGISFHVGSQCNNFDNYVQALQFASSIFKEAKLRGVEMGFKNKQGGRTMVLDIGGGFPARYTAEVKPFPTLAKKINSEIKRLFKGENIQVVAEPGRFLVADACTLVVKIIGKAVRSGKTCYYLNDGVYQTFSAQIFDHQLYPLHSFKGGEKKICATFGPTCDAFDTISQADELPEDLDIDDLLYAEKMGAYTIASASSFNGFSPAKVVHVNLGR